VERVVVAGWELVDSAIAHESLEADGAACGELVELLFVAGDDSPPEAEVDLRGALASPELGVERSGARRRAEWR
jgi:hypothetical protein